METLKNFLMHRVHIGCNILVVYKDGKKDFSVYYGVMDIDAFNELSLGDYKDCFVTDFWIRPDNLVSIYL